MAKYHNDARDAQLDAEILELDAAYRKEFSGEPEEVIEAPDPLQTAEEDTWKKRHADLRSYSQKQMNLKDQELSEIKAKLKELEEKKNSALPENKAELEDWMKEYPDLARVLGTMIDQRAERQVTSVADEVKDVRAQLEAERTAMARERAMGDILKKHPDFLDLVNQEDFKEWVESQPAVRGPRIGQALYDALYNNETDAEAAIQAVNIYKQDTAPARPKKDAARDAALSIRKTASTPPTNSGKRVYLESEIEKMSRWDFDKYEVDIDEARREGRYVYDISGAAR